VVRNSEVGINDFLPILRLPDTVEKNAVNGTEENMGVPVYDITVANVHEFYANEILVHNSADGDGAYTAGVKMARTVKGTDKYDFWVLDVVRGRWDAFTRERIIRQVAELDGKGVRIGMEQEPGSGGKESALNTIRNLAGFRVYAERATGSKIDRATPYASQVNGGFVAALKAPWTKAYLEEMKNFGELAKYKDQIDASSGAFNFLANRKKPAGGGGF
jgi:predicted phage terminase large subunit-like protein